MERPPTQERQPAAAAPALEAPPPEPHGELGQSPGEQERTAAVRERLNANKRPSEQPVHNEEAGHETVHGEHHSHHGGPSVWRNFLGVLGVIFMPMWEGVRDSAKDKSGKGGGGGHKKTTSGGGHGGGGHH